MRKYFDFLLTKKWFKGLVVFLPFTGIMQPYWYVILVFVYFIVVGWYLVLED